jgi:hypothetical protein
MIDRDQIIKDLKKMHNHIGIINDTELGRLVGFSEDFMDYYYIIRHICNERIHKDNEGFNTTHHSMVGSFVSLKDIYGDRYTHMDEIFTINGAPPSKEFIIKVEKTSNWFNDDQIGNEIL